MIQPLNSPVEPKKQSKEEKKEKKGKEKGAKGTIDFCRVSWFQIRAKSKSTAVVARRNPVSWTVGRFIGRSVKKHSFRRSYFLTPSTQHHQYFIDCSCTPQCSVL